MRRQLSSFQIIIGGFAAVILIGSMLLMLPAATQDGKGAALSDALFTATSAVCVTGLVVQDTATYWTVFGQGVILLLIQIGGMGVVTIAVLVSLISGRRIGLRQRSTMQEAIAAPSVGGIVKLTGFIVKTTIMIEGIGMLLLFPVFYKEHGLGRGLWYAIFHSISAFCNAGFDLMGEKAHYSSLTAYGDNLVINVVIMALIVIGGIGFLTWEDIHVRGMHIKKYRMQSKVILTMTILLISVPFFLFYFGEFSGARWNGMTEGEKILAALFQSITPRTAGFNTVDLTKLSEAGQSLIMILMLTGEAPGSTAGGMKVTTIAVLVMIMIAVFRRREDANCFGRRIPEDTVKFAATILLMYFLLFLTAGMVISVCEGLPMLVCLFETASAIGTVGLTLGITPTLGMVSRYVLIMLMFFWKSRMSDTSFCSIWWNKKQYSKITKRKNNSRIKEDYMKSILLIGLGRFGKHIAVKLQELNHEVMAIDKNEECVNEVLPYVTNAQIGDSMKEEFLRSLGVSNYDVCIVAIGNDFQGSLETTSLLKELGAKKVVSRAARDVQAKFLLRNGADEIVYPEKQLANWTAIRYSSDHIFDYIELSDEYAIFEIEVPKNWIGKTIVEIDIFRREQSRKKGIPMDEED